MVTIDTVNLFAIGINTQKSLMLFRTFKLSAVMITAQASCFANICKQTFANMYLSICKNFDFFFFIMKAKIL